MATYARGVLREKNGIAKPIGHDTSTTFHSEHRNDDPRKGDALGDRCNGIRSVSNDQYRVRSVSRKRACRCVDDMMQEEEIAFCNSPANRSTDLNFQPLRERRNMSVTRLDVEFAMLTCT